MSDINFKYFIGESSEREWASVYNYKPQSPEILSEKGEIFAVIKLQSPEGFNASTAGNLLIDELHETYFESKKNNITDCILHSITAVQNRISELLVNEEAAEEGVELDISVMVLRNNEVYFAVLGDNQILLLDEEKNRFIDLSKALQDPYGKGIIRIGSSFLFPNQKFLLTTKDIFIDFKESEVAKEVDKFTDILFKNHNFDFPELIALFMIGYQLPDLESPSLSNIQDLEAEYEEEDYEEENYQPEEITVKPDSEINNNLEDEEVVEGTNESPLSLIQNQFNKIKEETKRIPQRWQNLQNRRKQKQKFSELQSIRKDGADPHQINQEIIEDVYNKTKNYDNYSTFQTILFKTRDFFITIKDFILYDLLRVNQVRYGEVAKTFLTPDRLKMIGIVGGIILGVVITYSIISGMGARSARNQQIADAQDLLTRIETQLDTLETSPILNNNSNTNTSSRQTFIDDLNEVSGQFNETLDVLPNSDVDQQRSRIESMKNDILRIKELSPELIIDVGNIYEGEISDIIIDSQNIYLTDTRNGQLIRQPAIGGNSEVIATGIDSPQSLAFDGNNDIVVLSGGSGSAVRIISPVTGNVNEIAGITNTNFNAVDQSTIYGLTNSLYSVTGNNDQVRQLNKVGSSYSLPTTRYNDPNLGLVKDLAVIDARIVLLTSEQGLIRVDVPNSRTEAFSSDLDSIKSATAFGYDQDYIYIVDNVSDRLLVFTLDRAGQPIFDFVSQIPLSDIEEQIIEVETGLDQNRLILTTSTKVYSFPKSNLL
jgi:hypothetical protein